MTRSQPKKDPYSTVVTSTSAQQYLTFFIKEEEYGVNILRVVEIRGWEKPTPLPSTAQFVKGVINLRGAIVPIIDMRERFKLEAQACTELTVIIILQIESEDPTKNIIGIVADQISDVYSIDPSEVQAPPKAATNLDGHFITGLANVQDKMIILLDSDHLIDINSLTIPEMD